MTIQDALHLASQHSRAGRLADAEVIYRQILAQQANQPDAVRLLALTLAAMNRLDDALVYFELAATLQPNSAQAHNNVGVAYRRKGQLATAISWFNRAITLQANHAEALNNLGEAAYAAGDYDNAILSCRRALAARPDFFEAHLNLADASSRKGDVDQAIAAYRAALALRPDAAEAHNNLGNAWWNAKQPDKAIACCQTAIALRPGFAQAYSNIGMILEYVGRVEEAAAAIVQALTLLPDDPGAYWNLTRFRRLRRRPPLPPTAPLQLPRLPYLGDKVILLRCDPAAFKRLRHAGLHNGYPIDAADAPSVLPMAHLAAPRDPAKTRVLVSQWLDWTRTEAAMDGTTCTAWMPDMPPHLADSIRNAAADDLIEIAGDRAEEIHAQLSRRAVNPPPTDNKIFALVSIRNGGVELLPHWLEHYTQLGADELLVGIFNDLAGESLQAIDQCARRWKFRRFTQRWHTANEWEQYSQREIGCRQAGALPDTWILHTDLDELQEYPAPIRTITAAAAEKGIHVICGQFADRVAADGSLPPVQPEPSIWKQFPVQCKLSGPILKGTTQKVMLARYHVPVRPGHHETLHEPVVAPPIGRAEEYRVAHFKWHAGVLARLRWGLKQNNAVVAWKADALRFLDWLDRHGGRIDFSDPLLEANNTADPSC